MKELSVNGREAFTKLLTELALTYKVWRDDPKAYHQKVKEDNLVFTLIDAPNDLKEEMRAKRESKEPCIYQLHHTACSLSLVRELATLMHKGNLNCLPYELKPIIEAIAYEYINSDLEGFARSILHNGERFDVGFQTLNNIVRHRVSAFKKTFTSSVYQFPVTIFNLSGELQINKSIRLLPVHESDLTENQLAQFKDTRTFNYNYYLEASVPAKCSENLSLQLAEKSRDATYNALKLLATRLSPEAIPLLASNDRNNHLFDFYRTGKDRKNMSNTTARKFHSFQFDSELFWQAFHESRSSDANLIDTVFLIPELLLTPNFSSQRVVDRLERALLWYGDASTEPNFYQQIQKLVSSIEALVNFHDDKLTEVFKRRVTHLNITHNGLSELIKDKAEKIYKARSRIVHGSSIDERFDFCAIDFCSETLLRAIWYFSLFGFEKKGFNKKLPDFLDELPTHVELRCD
ncbi:hypothetical protein FB440_11677 [Vibrio crassostreae]|uniref:HEPN domain-containing protein n=1 Tax=Vibrio crassostreae TaxID=246167 RepID=UPI000FC32759|nr:HEPN domain-containing protein [Vibrio crassostreae]ROO76296.1 hypothetical protein EDB64_1285 [Vibrio crassostreae]ROP14306.1 hypothetical protein EDB63_1318 [Vibrio crassostreae]ROP24143.1 hypothetical protein EDB33_102259 [Vibrio crassostreae]ROP24687.1 hypothetical protein EDB34_102275 [Vibrio crassostreae]ROR87259.1 hypothetical protein EDB66_0186 [Vibrio crassostreae]